jgi:hypothetical protein
MTTWNSDQTRQSLASAEADFSGIVLRSLQKISVTDELSADPVYGNAPTAIGAPVGTHKAEVTFSVIPEEADNIINMPGGSAAYTRLRGSVGITTMEPGGPPMLFECKNVRILKVEADFGEAGGQKPALTTFTCAVYDPVNFNGGQSIESQGGGLLGAILGAVTAVAGALGI